MPFPIMAIMMAAGVASSLAQMSHERKIAKIEEDRSEKEAEFEAQNRRDELRRFMASQSLAAIGQGSSPDTGSPYLLSLQARAGGGRDEEIAAFNLAGKKLGYKSQRLSSTVKGMSGAADSIFSYYKANYQTTGAPKAGTPKPNYTTTSTKGSI